MAEAGVAPGAVIDDAEGENLGADQEIPQQQAQGEVAVNIMNQVLIWIGFDVVANRQALRSEIAEIKDMVDLTEKDITELQESYAKRTQNTGRMYFGLQRTKRLKATLHWVQDFARVSEVPTLEGLTQESFKAAISIAAQRADIRKKEAKDASSVSSEASPGKLKDAANLIAASVATLPESISKSRISSMNRTDASEGAESIYRNGIVYTGYYKKFHALSHPDRDKVMAERERQGIKKGPQKKTSCQVSFAKTTEKELAATKRKLKKANRKISSLQTKGDSESDRFTSSGDEPSNNSGNSFGGR